MLEPGTQIDKYRIVEKIGCGGMADVYRVEDTVMGRTVAMKILPPEFARNSERVMRFEKEVRNLASLNHPHIVTIYDVGHESIYHYYTMALLPNGDLKQRITQGLTPDQSIEIIRQISSALHTAHSKGLIHRDIKPQNIMFDDQDWPQLTDLGIAKAISAVTRMTQTGLIIGTPHYMSPEQARGKTIDGRSDLYNLGVVFYEMLTGMVPYEAEDTFAIGLMHINDPIPELPAALAGFQYFIAHLMAKDPEDRFADAEQLIQAISKYQKGDRVLLETDDTPQKVDDSPQKADDSPQKADDTLLKADDSPQKADDTLLKADDSPQKADDTLLLKADDTLQLEDATRILTKDSMDLSTASRETTASPPIQPPEKKRWGRVAATVGFLAALICGSGFLLIFKADHWMTPQVKNEDISSEQHAPVVLSTDADMALNPFYLPMQIIPAPSDSETEDQIHELLELAEKDLKAARWTDPKGSNAHERYKAVLLLDSENEQARQGLERIVDKYISLFDGAVKKEDFDLAEKHLFDAVVVIPESQVIASARKRLKAARNAKAEQERIAVRKAYLELEEKMKKSLEEERRRFKAEKTESETQNAQLHAKETDIQSVKKAQYSIEKQPPTASYRDVKPPENESEITRLAKEREKIEKQRETLERLRLQEEEERKRIEAEADTLEKSSPVKRRERPLTPMIGF